MCSLREAYTDRCKQFEKLPMTFEKALNLKLKHSKSVSSKSYRVIPNPKTDSTGYNTFIADLRKNKDLVDEDAKKYSTNSDFDVLEGHFY